MKLHSTEFLWLKHCKDNYKMKRCNNGECPNISKYLTFLLVLEIDFAFKWYHWNQWLVWVWIFGEFKIWSLNERKTRKTFLIRLNHIRKDHLILFVAKEWTYETVRLNENKFDVLCEEAHNQITRIDEDIEFWCERRILWVFIPNILNLWRESSWGTEKRQRS